MISKLVLFCCAIGTANMWTLPSLQTRVRRQSESYVEYRPGTLNVILSAPHGGSLRPDSIPDRSIGCWDGFQCIWSHDCGVSLLGEQFPIGVNPPGLTGSLPVQP